MNKKGFTLIETIITVAIIAILALVVVPNVVVVLDKSKEKSCKSLIENIESAAKIYTNNNKYDLDFTCGRTIEIKLKTLVDSGDLKLEDNNTLTNPLNDEEISLENTVSVTYNCDTNEFLYWVNGINCSGTENDCEGTATMPTIENHIYNGEEQTGVTGGENVNIIGDKSAKNLGTYAVTIVPNGKSCWSDKTRKRVELTWKITENRPNITLIDKTTEYTGNIIQIDNAVVKDDEGIVIEGIPVNYSYFTGNSCTGNIVNDGPVNVGNYSVKAYTNSYSDYNAAESDCTKLTITKATPTLTTSTTSISLTKSNTDSFTYTYIGDGSLSCSSSDESIATCSLNPDTKTVTITPNEKGNVTITVSANEGSNYKGISKTVSVNIEGQANPLIVSPIEGLIYNENAQTLVTVNNAQGTVYFSTTTKLVSSNYTSGSASIPKETNAKTYTVYYYTPGNTEYNESDGSVNVTISKAPCKCSITNVTTMKYPESTSGTITYSCTGDGTMSVISSNTNVITVGTINTTSAPLTAINSGTSTLTVSQASGTNYNACSVSEDITVKPNTYTISYDANGGENAPASQTKTYGVDLTLSDTEPTREDCEFLGWHTDKDATSAMYDNGDVFTINEDIVLYAVWGIKTVEGVGGTLVDYVTELYTNANKAVITNTKSSYGSEKVEYNYAADVSLMNDRLGGITPDYDAGNIRYYGPSPKNYIYFNCSDYSNQTDETCEKWRIIGVMKDIKQADGTTKNLVKIVKDTSVMKVAFDNGSDSTGSFGDTLSYSSDWTQASLNMLLNESYYNGDTAGTITYYSGKYDIELLTLNMSNIGLKNNTTRNMIQEVVWSLGEPLISSDSYPDEAYIVERASIAGRENYDIGKIALIYASDYGFATDLSLCDECFWVSGFSNTYAANANCTKKNWLFTNSEEWILSKNYGSEEAMVIYRGDGTVGNRETYYGYANVRPTLYLTYDTNINDLGDGSSENPFQIITSGTSSSKKYTITYDANGGENAPTSQTKTYGNWIRLSEDKPTREGYHFAGWNIDKDATTATYEPGNIFTINDNTTLYAVWDHSKEKINENLIDYITNLYLDNKDETLVQNNGISYRYASSVSLMNDRQGTMNVGEDDGNIRYYGKNPNNYIYFNCSDYHYQSSSKCGLWRIIGIVDGKVKITSATVSDFTTPWDSENYKNNWEKASLKTYLNGYYYTTLQTRNPDTIDLISTSTWYLGGWTDSKIYADEVYNYERTNKPGVTIYYDNPFTVEANIGLIYASDYGYATDFTACKNSNLNRYGNAGCYDNDYLNPTKSDQWIITPDSDVDDGAWFVMEGIVYSGNFVSGGIRFRPTLYLDTELVIESWHEGTSKDPYIISLQ